MLKSRLDIIALCFVGATWSDCMHDQETSFPHLSTTATGPRLTLKAIPPSTIPGEDIAVELRFENPTTCSIFFPRPDTEGSPQPRYRLLRPDTKEPLAFTMEASFARPRTIVDIIDVPANSTATYSIPLEDLVELRNFGRYYLDARVDWNGLILDAPVTTFEITPLDASHLHAGHGTWHYAQDPYWSPGAYLTFTHQGLNDSFLYGVRFEDQEWTGEVYPGDEYPTLSSPLRLLKVSKDATELTVAWPNHSIFQHDFVPWVFWREGRYVCARGSGDNEARRIALPFSPSGLVSPGLKAFRQSAEVLALSADRRTLAVVRFGNNEKNAPRPSGVRFTAPLPVQPLLATATLAPQSARSVRHIGFISASGTGIEISTTHYTAAKSKLGPFRRTTVPGVTLLADTNITMAAFQDGSTRLATAVLDLRGKLSILEATFPPDAPPRVVLHPLEGPDIAAPEVHLLYVHDDTSIHRLDAIVHTREDKLFQILTHDDGPWTVSPVRSFNPRPGAPVAIAAGREGPYVVSVSETGALDRWELQ